MATQNFIGKREAMSNNSSKYGYGLEGLCVKTKGGYRSLNGSYIETAVSTDASVIVKEYTELDRVVAGNIIIYDTVPFNVLNITKFGATSAKFEMLNLTTGEVESRVIDTAGRVVGVLWDTLKNPEKAVDTAQVIQLNEFTPQQLHDIATGKTTVEELRAPKQLNDVETAVKSLFASLGIALTPTAAAPAAPAQSADSAE